MIDETIELRKGGEIPIMVTFSRSGIRDGDGGLLVHLKVLPNVEQFFANMSKENGVVDVRATGRDWSLVGGDKDTGLQVYRFDRAWPKNNGEGFTMDKIGHPLLPDPSAPPRPGPDGNLDRQQRLVNLSFLRIVGSSRGVTFRVQGVYSKENVRTLRDSVTEALREFYEAYLRPVNLTVMVCTQDA